MDQLGHQNKGKGMGSKTGPQRLQHGDATTREPPPYPGHLQLWQQSGYSTSYSGSEASTDMSMSSLESLSTSARQEPQGEETTNVSPSTVDSCSNGLSSSAEAVVSSGFGSELDLKLIGLETGGNGNSVDLVTKECEQSQLNGLTQRDCYNSCTTTKSSIPSYGQLPSYSGNSLIRQLLQASPQFSHLLSDLAPVHGGTSSVFGSPKLQHGTISEVPCRQVFPVSSSVTTGGSLTGTPRTTSRFHASNCRTKNGYVNLIDENVGSSTSQSTTMMTAAAAAAAAAASVSQNPSSLSTTTTTMTMTTTSRAAASRDRVRPSTAPTERSSPAAAFEKCAIVTSSAITSTSSESTKQGSRRSYDALDSNTKARNDRKPTSDSDENGNIRGAPALQQVKPSQGHAPKLEFAADSNQGVSPNKLQEGAVIIDRNEHSQTYLRTHGTDSVDSPGSQRTSPRLQESPTTQQRSSPNQQQKLNDIGNSSCPLQNDGQQQTACAHTAIATRATQMVERLSEENRGLRQELKVYYKKVNKLEKVERDIQKIGEAYENLSQQSQKRENLEKLMRMRLESDISHLNDTNRQLQDQLESNILRLQRKQGYISPDSDLKKELQRKDCLIARLIAQNRELLGAKLKLESDVVAHRSALQDNQSRLQMLENILAKEALEKRRLVRQRSVSSDYLQGASASNNQSEEDFHLLQHQQCDTDDGIASDSESTTNLRGLIRQIQEKDDQVHRLESEVAKWESKFLEETVFRQLAVDAISIPKDAKIAALVQNSADSDRLLAETRLEKLAYMKELHESNERCAQLEARIKSLQADLIERESLIHVLQRHPTLSRANSISSLLAASAPCTSPLNSPQPQHRSPNGTVVMLGGGGGVQAGTASKLSSASSSRQSSQLSGSIPSHGKIGLSYNASPDVQNSHKKFSHMEAKQTADFEADQLQQCFWQV